MARAFCAGLAFSHGAGMALDAAQWITVHPNGKGGDKKGRPALIDSETRRRLFERIFFRRCAGSFFQSIVTGR